MKKIVITLILTLFSFTSIAGGMSPTVEQILTIVLSSDGFLNKQLHREFWHELEKQKNPQDVEKAIKALKANLLYSQEYQRETWKSVLITYQSRTVVRTERMIKLEKEMLAAFKETIPWPEGSKKYKNMLNGYLNRGSITDKNTKKLLIEAANRSSFKSPVKQDFVLTEQSINSVIRNIENSFNRLINLLDKNWVGNK